MVSTFIISLLISASLLYTWFNSSMPLLCLWILTKLGYKKHDAMFYMQFSSDNPLLWSDNDWNTYCDQYMSVFFKKLLNCKYCLCWHLCLWSTLYSVLISKLFTIINWKEGLLLMLLIPAQPILVHILLSIVKKEN
jgi:hypothetical protein